VVADIVLLLQEPLYHAITLKQACNVMQNLKQIDPTQWEQIPALAIFYDDLASSPYCTNQKGFSYIRTKTHAIRHTHIQPNHPAVCKWLAFDIDDPNALFTCFDEGLPPPQIIIKNPINGHAHYLYRLTTAVGIFGRSSIKAVRYLASVQKALADALGADNGYSGNLVKNPCHTAHETYLTGAQPSYTLAELANHLDLEPLYTNKPAQESANDAGYGRNCATFEYTRHKAYPIANRYNQTQLFKEVLAIALYFNANFDVPMQHNEVRHIAWSITRYCKSGRFGEFSEQSKAKFSRIQSCRVKRANKKGACNKGGLARSAIYTPKRQQAQQMHQQGVKIGKIATALNIHRNTIRNWINENS
jgi:hypothetical protein